MVKNDSKTSSMDLRSGGNCHRRGVRRLIGVVDPDVVVRRPDHVEVHVQRDLAQSPRFDLLLDPRRGPDQTGFLPAPPGEAQGVARGMTAEVLGDLEQCGRAAPVVVDARSGEHRVEVGASHDDVLVIRRPPSRRSRSRTSAPPAAPRCGPWTRARRGLRPSANEAPTTGTVRSPTTEPAGAAARDAAADPRGRACCPG